MKTPKKMPSKLNEKYRQYSKKYKDKYRLIYDFYHDPVCYSPELDSSGNRYKIERKDDRAKAWHWATFIEDQPEKGFWSIIGLGHKEYSDVEWAKKCFIEYVDRCEKVKYNDRGVVV